jgi:hypothetical protein
MAAINRCWAYNKTGIRCEHPAGHPGNHVVMQEWTDDECFSPIRHQLPEPATLVTHISPALIPEDKPVVEKCAACSHSHKSGPCKCGCYEYIG